MNHALLKSVIYDQHEFIRNFQSVPRDYEFEENGNYVLVGLRRAGKSTLLYKIVLDLVASGVDWEQIIYITVIQPIPVLSDPARPSAVMPVQPPASHAANAGGAEYHAYSVKSNER